MTPQHPNSFNKNGANATTSAPQQATSAPAPQPVVQQPPQPDPSQQPFSDLNALTDVCSHTQLVSSLYTKLTWINRRLRLILTSLVWSHLIFWKTLILIHSSIPMRIRPGLDSIPTYPMPLTVWKPVPVTACKRSSATVIRVFFC